MKDSHQKSKKSKKLGRIQSTMTKRKKDICLADLSSRETNRGGHGLYRWNCPHSKESNERSWKVYYRKKLKNKSS